jgi:hypothetical protein
MLNGGGRSLEETRQIRTDEGLREIFYLSREFPPQMPLGIGFGAWVSMVASVVLKK